MKPVPADAKRGWTITADGVIIRPRKLTLESRFGVWTYGVRPEGYDSIVIGEAAGGGAATLPYSYAPDGRLLVGLVMENRPNMGDEPTPCLMGGFVKLGETHAQAQTRFGVEEGGMNTGSAKELQGFPANFNRAYCVADAKADEGLHVFAVEIDHGVLDSVANFSWKLKPTAHWMLPGAKNPDALRFFTWRMAVRETADALARSAIAQLLADLPEVH
ncbi:MAG: hypothetical protein AAB511_02245 [Patescibacteria group bacterium]